MGELVDHGAHLAVQLGALLRVPEESLRLLHVALAEAFDASNGADELSPRRLLRDREERVRYAGHR